MIFIISFFLMTGCNPKEPAEISQPPVFKTEAQTVEVEEVQPDEVVVPEVQTTDVQTVSTEPTSESLYLSCKDRVEGKEADNECTTDEDCSTGGCSQEVCVAKDLAPEIISTCEVRPCFSVLDTCGCHEGRCTWTLKEPSEMPRIPIPQL